MKYILGISAFYHDAAACLLGDGEIVAAAQEERFTRKKADARFPIHAIEYCLKKAGIDMQAVDAVIFYEKPFVTFERLLETYLQFAPRGFKSFVTTMPIWIKEKLFLRQTIERQLRLCVGRSGVVPPLLFSEHHRSHAASAYYPSPFKQSAILCMDGVGEWATTSAWLGEGRGVHPLWEIRFPHSLGLLYSAFTTFTGFKVNSGEYKVMGMAPYGRPIYVRKILEELMDVKADGTFRLNTDYFAYCTDLKMTNEKFAKLFDGPPRTGETEVTQRDMDLARSIQDVTEEIVLRLGRKIHAETGSENLCMAGGVALNCVANGRLLREGPFKNIWIQPASGDAGGCLGAAYLAWHEYFENERHVDAGSGIDRDSMKGAYLGPSFAPTEIEAFLRRNNISFRLYTESQLYSRVAEDLKLQKVVGWFQGRMEFGPRSLGARSILGDARSVKMQSVMNLKIKFRESFRPFAPAVLAEKVSDYFEINTKSPYMLFVAKVRDVRRKKITGLNWGLDLMSEPKSDIPAVTHVDFSARVQTVHAETNPRFHALLVEFERQTGCAVLINTSFNVRGQPIVCSPEDAYQCFMGTQMDTLVLENYVLDKSAQSPANAEQVRTNGCNPD